MLDLDPKREGATPRDAATLILLREGRGGLEVFCVERHKKGFMGGAIVFPGGKLDESDASAAWDGAVNLPRSAASAFAADPQSLRALAIAACRETLEEAAILPVAGGDVGHDELLALRARVAKREESIEAFLRARGLLLDLAALQPFARWITPVAESRRFDARFFLAIVGDAQRGAHDDHETMASFWARPAEVLARFADGKIQLAPPTHRSLELLAGRSSAAEAMTRAESACLDPICPRLVRQGEGLALTLPGDPEHDIREPRVPGTTRFVLRAERWLPEDPP